MYKKKSIFITFEGIEGSGKSYHSRKLFKTLRKNRLPAIYTREPGGTKNGEIIRAIILNSKKNYFDKYSEAFLYFAARNELVHKVLIPSIKKKKIIICDRFTDSTLAYQVYGFGIKQLLVDTVHKIILNNIKPDLTFVLKVNVDMALKRVAKRGKKNRYDKFTRNFYSKIQNAFLKVANKNKNKYLIIDTSQNIKKVEKLIYANFMKILKK
jgi:dTMP kinase